MGGCYFYSLFFFFQILNFGNISETQVFLCIFFECQNECRIMQNNATWMPFLTYIASYFFQVIYQGKKILILTFLSMSGDERKLIKKIYIYMYIYTKITLLSFSNTRSDLDQLGLLTHKSIINIPKLFSFLIINYL